MATPSPLVGIEDCSYRDDEGDVHLLI